MTLDKLEELALKHFGISKEGFRSTKRNIEFVVPRHCMRALAINKYKLRPSDFVKEYGTNHATIIHSCRLIQNGQFEKEYNEFMDYVVKAASTEVVVGTDGIGRVTNDAYDERHYSHPTKTNTKTGLPYFPAFHFITKLGAPESPGLSKWRQTMGHFADHILSRTAEIGSFVHDSIDRMIKSDSVVSHDEITHAFSDAKEAHRVKECLLSFMNFIKEEEPIILASEKMMVGDDFGFTLDAQMRLKSDNYKHKWTVDWKTSKVANEDHKMQVEVMRRVSETDRGAVVVLGNSTKKGYTMTQIKPSDHDYLWGRFQAIKETAYVEILKRGLTKPREDNMPKEFSLKELNFKRKL